MGHDGQSTSNGGGGGTTRAGANTLSQMQALVQKTGTAADVHLAQMIRDCYDDVEVDDNQQLNDTQRFVNATGIADKRPNTVSTEKELDNLEFLGVTRGTYIYHTDAPFGSVSDAKTFGDQYQKGRMYLSSGWYGDGTYFSTSSTGSWSYGGSSSKAYQLKGMLNSNAREINYNTLQTKIRAFKRSHPKAAKAVSAMTTGYGGTDGQASIYALLFGYNVIRVKNATYRSGEDYLAVLDRSVTTVVKKGIYPGDGWDY